MERRGSAEAEIAEELPTPEATPRPRIVPMSYVYDAVEAKTLTGIIQLQYLVRKQLRRRRRKHRVCRRLVVAGPPAGGKGTLCDRLVDAYGVVHLSTGDILRAAVRADSALGRQANAYMVAGDLVPDSLMISLILDRLRDADCTSRGWLLDGFPRTQAQATAMLAAGISPDLFVQLIVPDGEVIARIAGRRVDVETNKTYHMTFDPPPPDRVDKVIQRADDTEAAIRVRLNTFHQHATAVANVFAAAKTRRLDLDGMAMTKNGMVDAIDAALSGPKLVILGPPAGGKGTQCDLLVAALGVVHISTGDMLRAAANTPLGRQAKAAMDTGDLVPDDVIIRMLLERLGAADCILRGWLLDGFPRTRAQVDALLARGLRPDLVLVLHVPDDEVVSRIAGRRIDPTTGASYHVTFNPPPNGVAVVQRDDDTEETLRVRLRTYHTHAEAVVAAFAANAIRIVHVDGVTSSKAAITAQVQSALAPLQNLGVAPEKPKPKPKSKLPTTTSNPKPQTMHPEKALQERLQSGPMTLAALDAIMHASSAELEASRVKAMVDTAVASVRHAPKVIFLAPPGLSIELYVQYIRGLVSVVHLNAEQSLLKAIQRKSVLGESAGEYVHRREPVPKALLQELVLTRLERRDCLTTGWLLDGFPQSIEDAEALIARGLIPHVVFVLRTMVADDELVQCRIENQLDLEQSATSLEVEEERIRLELLAYHDQVDDILMSFAGRAAVVVLREESALETIAATLDAQVPKKPAKPEKPVKPAGSNPRTCKPKRPQVTDADLDAAAAECKQLQLENEKLKRRFLERKPSPPQQQMLDKNVELQLQALLSEKKSLRKVTMRQKESIDANEWHAILQASLDELDLVKLRVQACKKAPTNQCNADLTAKVHALQTRYDALQDQWRDLNEPKRVSPTKISALAKLRKREAALLKTDEQYYSEKAAQFQLHTSQEVQRMRSEIDAAIVAMAAMDSELRAVADETKAAQAKLPKIPLPQLKLPKCKPVPETTAPTSLPRLEKPQTSDKSAKEPRRKPHTTSRV
ncbi:hypothetical protein SDRG_06581 [Saprolegnia diclina VS20]|uniref:Adenylate kinase n=1 Tax=Saprolegnia diclina (strain VS20) TaxID=1156394 RepID=T0RZJ1_SAPDV|nr:hypothetical protein SDRG_06581 [Saprolegnia diclina VS20]EQC35827.1 hypothetical protein SDRG_06581 [Saprolegnia diclina VS20]|eukprot:XP_008610589.1 hypothetical protein SDRG_06581 [Saprolegnia diclina VS20]